MTLVLICQWSRILQRKETPRTDSSPSSANESLLSGSNNTNQRLHYLSSIISKNWLQLSPSWNYWHFNVGKVEGGREQVQGWRNCPLQRQRKKMEQNDKLLIPLFLKENHAWRPLNLVKMPPTSIIFQSLKVQLESRSVGECNLKVGRYIFLQIWKRVCRRIGNDCEVGLGPNMLCQGNGKGKIWIGGGV